MDTSVKVWRKAEVVVTYVGEPQYDTLWQNNFIPVSFIDKNGTVIKNSLFAGHIKRLPMLKEGNKVGLVYEASTGWIKSIDGKRWN